MRWALLACAVLVPSPVAATPLLAPRTGGSVFVGPTNAHVSSIFWNPAAAGLMEGVHFLISGAARLDFTRMSRSTISTADGEPSATGDKGFSPEEDLLATPGGFIGVTTDFSSDSLTVGLASHMLYADRSPPLPDGRYHADGGSLYAAALTAAVSYRISRSFYAGIGVSLLFPKLDLTFLRDAKLESCTATPCGVEDVAAAERWDIDTGFGPSVGFNGGLLVRFGVWWIGFAINNLFLGDIRKSADIAIERPGAMTIHTSGRVIYDLPLLANLGIRRPLFSDFDLVVNASYTQTSSHDVYDVRLVSDPVIDEPEWVVRHRGLNDAYAFEAGIEQPPATRLRLGARARFETSAVPAGKVAVDRVDGFKLELAGGVELRLSERVALSATGSLVALLPVDADPSEFSPRARIDCDAADHDVNTPACAAVREGRGIPTAAGSYWRAGGELTLGFSYDVW